MIKVEDTISRVIICFLTLLFLFYGFMFTGAESATGFLERIGVSSSSIDAIIGTGFAPPSAPI